MVEISVNLPIKYKRDDLIDASLCLLPVSRDEIGEIRILKRSLTLSDNRPPMYKMTLALSFSPEREAGLLKMRNKVKPYIHELFVSPTSHLDHRPVVVGAGPAGLFAALTLAESGARPIILERGMPVEERIKSVALFNSQGVLDTESNVQFGEGGAGAFSDGKLKMGAHDKYKNRIVSEFISAGADPSIAYSDTAHLGTDKLPGLIAKLREKIIALGGEFIYSARFVDVKITDGAVSSVVFEKNGSTEIIDTRSVILATGHSARDTIRMLYEKGLTMTPRGFGIGARIEHPREYMNTIVYKNAKNEIEETATYHLVTHLPSGRSVYSFCMCPGGTVVGATSTTGGVVTNGMSEYSRMADNSNSALLVSVTPDDFGSSSPLSGIELQEKIERAAYLSSGSYKAPAESLGHLLTGENTDADVTPSYPLGTENIPLKNILPEYITDSIKAAMPDFDAWLPGFANGGAVLTGPETRTTSPVRIERLDSGEALGFRGLYPTGEGAGYSGGIISSAVDGMRQAERLINNAE